MKTGIFALIGLCLGVCAQAQLPAPISQTQADAELARIQSQRNALEARYGKDESVCYQRFAVNDCLLEVRARKRVSLEELRRQEIVLNDAKRKTRALELTKQAEEKTSPAALKQDAERRESAQIQHRERQDRAHQKKLDALEREKQAGSGAGKPPAATGSPAKESSDQAQKVFEEKQRNAQERKAQRDKSIAERKGKPVNSLPTQP